MKEMKRSDLLLFYKHYKNGNLTEQEVEAFIDAMYKRLDRMYCFKTDFDKADTDGHFKNFRERIGEMLTMDYESSYRHNMCGRLIPEQR